MPEDYLRGTAQPDWSKGDLKPTKKGKRKTELLVNLLLTVGSVLVLCLLAEATLRIGTALLKPRFTRVDAAVGWYHTPSTSGNVTLDGYEHRVTYNSHGYRYPEHSFSRTDDTRRIVVLGDSFTDGSEVGDTETYTWLLQQRLADTEVINLGVYSYSTAQELVTLETVGLRFDPDLVILMTLDNDLWNNVVNFSGFGPAPRFVLDGNSLEFEGTDHPNAREAFRATNLPVPWMTGAHRHSYLYYLLNHYVYQRLHNDRIWAFQKAQVDAVPEAQKRELYLRIVDRIHEAVQEAGTELLVVFAYPRSALQQNQTSPHSDLASELEGRGIAALDLFDSLKTAQETASEPIYFEHDIHWNPAGHQVVATLLEKVLAAR